MSDGSVLSKCFAGGVGCGLAGFATNPCDVIKVRNQQFADVPKYKTFRGTAASIFREEGVRGFYKGASASVLRECTYSSLRMGLYEPIKAKYSLVLGDESSPAVKWLSAFTSGAIGSAVSNVCVMQHLQFTWIERSPLTYELLLLVAFVGCPQKSWGKDLQPN